jgi:cobalt-zinc-cadmium efflux system outer membrane protein
VSIIPIPIFIDDFLKTKFWYFKNRFDPKLLQKCRIGMAAINSYDMLKKYAFAFCACLFSLFSNAQNNEVARVLEAVKQNNKELKAFASMLESEKLELQSGNNLSNPQLDALYLPFGDHSTADYAEYQITQSFEFPTVYAARKNLINKQQQSLALVLVAKRQAVLLDAKKHCVELVILNKALTIEQTRVAQAKQVFEQVNTLFEKEQVGILAFNKAKIAWLQEQFSVQTIRLEQQSLLAALKTLNGGIELTITSVELLESYGLAGVDSLWNEKLRIDPSLISMQQKEAIALQEIKLSKHKTLPNLSAGFNHQGFAGETYAGFYGGIALPIFGNKHKVKAAKANFQFQQTYSNVQASTAKVAFEKQYHAYTLLLAKFEEYEETLAGLNSDALLLTAYELGEISFMDYYAELQFYRQASDTMLNMEKELNLLKAALLKHQL